MRGRAGLGAMLSASVIASAAAIALAAPAPPPASTPIPAPGQRGNLELHIQAATKAAGLDLWGILSVCLPSQGPEPRPANDRAEPAKVFDNFYFLGIPSVSAWAITTSQGIIVIDSLDNQEEARTFIEGGLRKLGLDPAQIKYVVITHAHADHYGGASYLADTFKAELVMSDADWTFLEGQGARPQQPNRGPIPKRGKSVKDGETLRLGDTTIELYVTPPHTPGTLSLILPLKDGAMMHVGGLWGGTAFNFQPTEQNFNTYAASADRFKGIAAQKGVDVTLSNHPSFDDALMKIDALKKRGPNQPHPFVTGPEVEARYMTVASECAKARAAALVEPPPADPSGLVK